MASGHRQWVVAMLLVGGAYAAIGVGSAALDNAIWAGGWRPWRVGAWVGSGIVAAAHIMYEHYRLGSAPVRTALHAAEAVALGALGMAIGANIHWLLAEPRPLRPPLLALPLFPLITAIPAFPLALVAAAVLNRVSRRGGVA